MFVFNTEAETIEARSIVLERNKEPRLGLLALNQIVDGSSPEPTSGSASNTHKHYFLP